jgi:hypothetical protein
MTFGTLDMAIGMATILVLLGAAGTLLMLQELQTCFRSISEVLRGCRGDPIAAAQLSTITAALLLLGAKQGQDVYLAGQLLPSFLRHTCADTNHACCRHIYRLPWACECQCRADY